MATGSDRALNYLEAPGKAVIGSLRQIDEMLLGRAGTLFSKECVGVEYEKLSGDALAHSRAGATR